MPNLWEFFKGKSLDWPKNDTELAPGVTLQGGAYRIESTLGQGGFGITYRATWYKPGGGRQTVAIKEFFPRDIVRRNLRTGSVTMSGLEDAETFQARLKKFVAEGEFLHAQQRPHIVTVYHIFEERGTAYLVMEYLEGPTLRELLRAVPEGGLSVDQVRRVMRALVKALANLHERNVYHLDIKPSNVLCCNDGRVVLIDFGASKQGTRLATQSQFAVTPRYAPLEMLGGREFGPETDIFQVGMMLHELLTGDVPPAAGERTAGTAWQPSESLAEPWREMIRHAVELERAARPKDIRAWWAQAEQALEAATIAIAETGGNRADLKMPKGMGRIPDGSHPESAVSDTLPTGALLLPLPPKIAWEHLPNPESLPGPLPPPTSARTRRNPVDGAEMVWIPAGTFLMGGNKDGNVPKRLVFLEGYWIYKYPVTVAQYKKFCEATGAEMPPAPYFNPDWLYEEHPIVNVSWDEATHGYCEWAGVALPTEAQWEKAARGTDGRIYPWGDHFEDSHLWDSVTTRRIGTTSVFRSDSCSASPFGLMDMAGNVAEWCRDRYAEDYYAVAPARNPQGPAAGEYRVIRGGSWDDQDPAAFRTDTRHRFLPGFGYAYWGFRPVCEKP